MEFVTAGLFPSIWATVLLAGVVFACAGIGALFLAAVVSEENCLSFFEWIIFSISVGIIILSLSILGIGSAGFLRRDVVIILLAGFAILPLLVRKRSYPHIWQIFTSLFKKPLSSKAIFFLLAGAAVLLAWVSAVSPPIGNDALAYHLAHPKEFVLAGKIAYLAGTRESLWPYLTEMLYTVGLLLQGTMLATLFHWFFLVITACAVYTFGKRFFDEKIGCYAVIVFLFTPAAFAQASYAYVDLSLAFYIFMAVYPLILAKKIGYERAAFLSGLFCGGALSTKYLALGVFAILFILWVVTARSWRACALFLLGSVLVSMAWYLKSWMILGNPVYPFFHELFNGNGYPSSLGEKVGMGKGFLSFLLLGWNITMHPTSFGGESLGPFYLLFMPWLVPLAKGARKESLVLTLFCFFYVIFIFTQSQQARFFLSAIPLLCVSTAASLCFLMNKTKWLKCVAGIVLSVVIVLHLGIYIYRTRDLWAVWLGRTGPYQYLMKHERSFEGYSYLKQHIKAGERLFNAGEGRQFYSPLRERVFYNEPFLEALRKKGLTLSRYLDEERFEYLWISRQSDEAVSEYVRTGPYREVFSYSFKEGTADFYFHIYKRSDII